MTIDRRADVLSLKENLRQRNLTGIPYLAQGRRHLQLRQLATKATAKISTAAVNILQQTNTMIKHNA